MSSYVKQEIQKRNFDTTYGRRRKQWTTRVICHARWFIIHWMWHFNGIWQICFWGDDFKTMMSGNGKILYSGITQCLLTVTKLTESSQKWLLWPPFSFRQELLLEGWLIHLTNYAWMDTINVCSLDSMKAPLQRPRKKRLFVSVGFS